MNWHEVPFTRFLKGRFFRSVAGWAVVFFWLIYLAVFLFDSGRFEFLAVYPLLLFLWYCRVCGSDGFRSSVGNLVAVALGGLLPLFFTYT